MTVKCRACVRSEHRTGPSSTNTDLDDDALFSFFRSFFARFFFAFRPGGTAFGAPTGPVTPCCCPAAAAVPPLPFCNAHSVQSSAPPANKTAVTSSFCSIAPQPIAINPGGSYSAIPPMFVSQPCTIRRFGAV